MNTGSRGAVDGMLARQWGAEEHPPINPAQQRLAKASSHPFQDPVTGSEGSLLRGLVGRSPSSRQVVPVLFDEEGVQSLYAVTQELEQSEPT